MEKIDINTFRQKILALFFDGSKAPRSISKDKLGNYTYYWNRYGIPSETFNVVKSQLINDGYLFDNETSLTPTSLGEKFFKSGGFNPNRCQIIKRFFLNNWIEVTALILSLLSLVLSIISLLRPIQVQIFN